jgi:hypothetical protein
MRVRLGEGVHQEVGEVAAEHLFEPCARWERLRLRVSL